MVRRSAALATLARLASTTRRPVSRRDFMLGTVVDQRVSGRAAAYAAEAAASELLRVHRLLSFYDPASDIARLNGSAGAGPVKIAAETLNLLALALEWSGRTAGAFGPTVGPLSRLWKEAFAGGMVPGPASVRTALSLAGSQQLRLNPGQGTAELLAAGASVDLGAIGKGYAARRARQVYESHGITSALLNLGGHVLAFGGRPDGRPWSVGIRHPRRPGRCIGAVDVRDASVSTSGDYEQFAEQAGVRYHHIVDPRTGCPARSGLISVTVVTRDPLEADVLSTAVFVAGASAARGLLGLAPHAGGVLVGAGGQVMVAGEGGWQFQAALDTFSGAFREAASCPPAAATEPSPQT